MKMIQKGFFQGMFFNNLKRKIRTGHIGKQDNFDPQTPPSPFLIASMSSIFRKKGVMDLEGTPAPFTDKICKVVFDVLPY